MRATEWAGSSFAFAGAVSIIAVWVVTGPLFGFSDTWQLVINTGTTVVTFLMVFLIQRAQNKESKVVIKRSVTRDATGSRVEEKKTTITTP